VHRVALLTHRTNTASLLRSVSAPSKWQLAIKSNWADLRQETWASSSAPQGTTESPTAVLDLATVASSKLQVERAIAEIKQLNANTRVVLLASSATLVDAIDERWASMAGAELLIPALSALRWEKSGALLQAFVARGVDVDEHEAKKRSLPFIIAAQRIERSNAALANLASVAASGIDLAELAKRMVRSGGVEVKNRLYHFRSYPECFVASEAADWIESALGVSAESAVAVGLAMQEAGLIYHVAREKAFAAEFLFFRASAASSNFVLSDFVSLCRSAGGFDVRDRDYMGTNYPRCFIGSEAVGWMQKTGLSLNEAMSVGERMIRLSIISHVLNEHPFQDAKYFYRFGDERMS
jgi:hypothetical protein